MRRSDRGENVPHILRWRQDGQQKEEVLQLPHGHGPSVTLPLGSGLQVYQGPIFSFNRSCYDSIIAYMDKCTDAGPEVETFIHEAEFPWTGLAV